MSAEVLDTRGLSCPLPVLRARKVLLGLAPGTELQVLATDPGTVRDFQAFCEASGHELLEQREQDGLFVHRMRRAG